jgi:peptide/nickel transport system permease protein
MSGERLATEASTELGVADVGALAHSPARLSFRRFLHNHLATGGAAVLLLMAILAILAPLLAPYDPNAVDLSSIRQAPDAAHWLGTDDVGRDVLSRMLYGARISLSIGVVAALTATVLGLVLGLLAGLGPRWLDGIIMRLVDVVIALPGMVILLLLAGAIGPGFQTLVIVITFFFWTSTCRIVQQVVRSIRENDYVFASRAFGAGTLRIALVHVLPGVLSPLTVVVALNSVAAILTESALSFLGLGIQQPQPSWGGMMTAAASIATLETTPWLWIPPGLAIATTVLAINFIGDGLRDALDTKQKV